MSLLARTSVRWWRRHPWQIALSVLGVALGVGVVLSIDLTNASARRAFDLSTRAVAGAATHQLAGGPEGLPEELYADLRVRHGVRPAAPVLEAVVTLADHPGETFQLLGVDPLAEPPFRQYLGRPGATPLGPFLTTPGAVVMSRASARRLGVQPGDDLRLVIGGSPRTARLVGVLEPDDELSRRALAGIVLADISTAQELTGRFGTLDRIDLIVPDGPRGEAALASLREILPEAVRVVPTGARSSALEQMTRAFRLNLSALSLLALFVGLFLIYNTMTFSVVQRRELFGNLRTLGASRGQVGRLILAEAAVVGVVGTAVGIPLGLVLADGLLGLVTRTINDLYYVLSVRDLDVPVSVVAKAGAMGIGAAVLAALPPAREAVLAPPLVVSRRAELERSRHRALWRSTAMGLVLLGAAAILMVVPSTDLVLAFAGVFALLAGCALLSPGLTVLLVRAMAPLAGALLGAVGRMALRGIDRSLSRHAVAVAALMTAISVTISVGVMIGSFRTTVERWLGSTLRADIYVSAPTLEAFGGGKGLDPGLVSRLSGAPGVARATTVRRAEWLTGDGPVRAVAFDFGDASRGHLPLKTGEPERAWKRFFEEGAVFVTEPFAYRTGIGKGDEVVLPAREGPRAFPVAGVVYDYSSDRGFVMMSRRTYQAHWDDTGVSGLGLIVERGADVDRVLESLRPLVDDQPVIVRSSRALREASMEVFDRTFTVTAVLRALALVVAFMGVVSAQLAIQLESRRQTGLLRAVGLAPRQLWTLVESQTGAVGLIAGLQAIPLGVVLGAVMIFIVNRRSFGWTMTMQVDPALLVQGVAVAVGAALLAGAFSAWSMARGRPADALRAE